MTFDDWYKEKIFDSMNLHQKEFDKPRTVWNAAVNNERDKLAEWMIERGYATGHGDTIEDLLYELGWQIDEQGRP